MQKISRKGPKPISLENALYIVGFVDGEGSFNISFKIRTDYANRIQVYPSFNISQKEKGILVWIQNQFGCGTIRNRGDGVYYYEVHNLRELKEKIILFFDRYKLRTKKKIAFEVFSKTIEIISSKNLEWIDIKNIYALREEVVVGRKRKYLLKDLEKIWKSSETTRQIP